jgi:hypothetical protein
MANEEGGGDNSMGWLGAIGAAAIGGILSNKGQEDANKENVEIARENRAFQERMSNSAYQRAVEDMKKAGINPMLVTQVGGASSPTGNMPTVQNSLGAGVASAQQAMATYRELQAIDQTKATTQQIKATTDKTISETLDKNLNTAYKAAQTEKEKRDAMLKATQELKEFEGAKNLERENIAKKEHGSYEADAQKRVSEAELTRQEIAKGKAEENFWQSPVGKSMPYLRGIFETLRGINSARPR